MRVLHIADLHIGVENYGRFQPERALHTRLIDFLECLDVAVAAAITEQVDLVLIAGDMFKNRDPQPRHQREFAARIRRIRDAGIPILMIIGNHDTAPNRDAANAVAVYEGLRFDGVDIARMPSIYRYDTAHGPLAVIAIPWIIRENLMARYDALRNAALGEQEMVILRIIEQYVEQATETLMQENPERPIIVTYHGTVSGAVNGFERQLMLGREIQLSQSTLTPVGVDYVALGHVHKHQALRESPPMVYPGSIERIDFGEINETKGYVMVSFAGKHATWEFRPLPARRFVHLSVDVRQHDDPMDAVMAFVERADITSAIVRITVTIDIDQRALLRANIIRARLDTLGAAHVARVDFDVVAPAAATQVTIEYEGDMPTHHVALERYIGQQGFTADEARALLELGNQIIDIVRTKDTSDTTV